MNRKLIRPSLTEVKRDGVAAASGRDGRTAATFQPPPRSNPAPVDSATISSSDGDGASHPNPKNLKKGPPPVDTSAEVFYYKKQIDTHTSMIIVLQDGEEIEGTIEWYDRAALKINRKSAPNILLLKHNIKYMFKAEDRTANNVNG